MSVAAPAPRTAPRRAPRPSQAARGGTAARRRRRSLLNGAVLWVVLLAALFGGIVALNVAALRGTIASNSVEAQAQQLRTENGALAAEVAEKSGFWRISAKAAELGMVPSQPQRSDFIPFRRGHGGRGSAAPVARDVPGGRRP